MTEHKFTDEEIIKALECCNDNGGCDNCPFNGAVYEDEPPCVDKLTEAARNLINRQKAEVAYWMDAAANAKKEAIKEFAEKLKGELTAMQTMSDGKLVFGVSVERIESVVKEMLEGG
jgi:hypothetical protein